MAICSSLRSRFSRDLFLNRIVTSDEKWVLCNNIQRKKQWLASNEKGEATPKRGLHSEKVMLCVWWDMKGVIYHEVLQSNETIKAERYCRQFKELLKNLKDKNDHH